MSKKTSVFFTTNLEKNEEQGGAWLLHIVKRDNEEATMAIHYSAWKSLPAAKRKTVEYIGKRPKWEMNENKTKVTALTEQKILLTDL
jgi:ABC-type Fe3+-citrate transport system substrate-binding protein